MNYNIGLFDGNGIYRRFHGAFSEYGDESSSERAMKAMEETQRKIINLCNKLSFSHTCIFFDGEGENWRREKYPLYKIDTKTMLPKEKIPEMTYSIRACQNNLNELGFKTYRNEKLEADDGIANVTNILRNKKETRVVITGIDKDFDPLIGDNILGYDPFKNFYKNEQWVIDKYGLSGDKLVECFALSGDASDNIPGIYGVKYKKAKKMLEDYGSIENIILCSEDMSEVMNKNVTEAKNNLFIYKELINLREINFSMGFKLSDMRTPSQFLQKKYNKYNMGMS